jgi:hypothetical protein
VREVTHCTRLATEATDEIPAIRELGVQDLDRDHAVHVALERFVHAPHPAGPDPLKDLELAVQDVSADERILRAHGAKVGDNTLSAEVRWCGIIRRLC